MGLAESSIGTLINIQKINQGKITLVTLNYSGILNSPFQFFSSDNVKMQQSINERMKKLCIQRGQEGKPHQWKLGKIDKQIQKQRYSPLYMKDCGIFKMWNQNLNKDQFKQIWNYQFIKFKQRTNKLQFKQSEIQEAIDLDYLCYQAIWEQSDKKIQNYENIMKEFFSKAFLNEKQKVRVSLQSFKNKKVDILFLQQATQQIIDELKLIKEYEIIQPPKNNSIIAIKIKKFSKIHNTQQQLKKINRQGGKLYWNQDTAIAFVDNFILFSIHLSSKKEKNAIQINQMLKDIIQIKKEFPDKQIIVAGDANNKVKDFLNLQNENIKLFVVPKENQQFTCKKKRTYLQPQTKKANEQSFQIKDNIISTLQIQSHSVETIEGMIHKQIPYLPSSQHPFDHLAVIAYLKYNKSQVQEV